MRLAPAQLRSARQLLDLLSQLVTPPRLHRHRCCGVSVRSPPQLAIWFDQTSATTDWPEMDQTVGTDDGWQ